MSLRLATTNPPDGESPDGDAGPALISVNGAAEPLPGTPTVAALLEARGLAGKRVAVERNGAIVPRSQHAVTTLVGGDRLEIVVAVGGG